MTNQETLFPQQSQLGKLKKLKHHNFTLYIYIYSFSYKSPFTAIILHKSYILITKYI
jgi:hypothetical protein